jgi:hypothetical protein
MIQQNLFYVEQETSTASLDYGICSSQIIGDLGEMEFDVFCTKNKIAYYRSSSAAAPIDRIILTNAGKAIRVHVKASIRCYDKVNKHYRYQFKTYRSTAPADYYFCTGFLENSFEKVFSLWIPHELVKDISFVVSEQRLYKYLEFQKVPEEIMDVANILPFTCP